VPEFLPDGSLNVYYPALNWMKRLCDEDFDMVFVCSFGFQTQAWDISKGYNGCKYAGDGTTSTDPKPTYFMSTGGYLTSDLLSTGFSKIYQMRYTAGLIAGHEMLLEKAKLDLNGDTTTELSVGYIAAFPIPEVQRGINAFALGCQEVYPDCKVKVVWTGVWSNPEQEAAAAAFIWNIGKSQILTTHIDTLDPLRYFDDHGGVILGYHQDSRGIIGDNVLQTSFINWQPVFSHYVESIIQNEWSTEQIWLGVDLDAVSMAPYFSPRVPEGVQRQVRNRIAELKEKKGDEAFHDIFCGKMYKRWAYAKNTDTGECLTGCGFQPTWTRLDTPELVNPAHYWDKDGNRLTADSNVTETDCLYGVYYGGQALLETAFPDPFDSELIFSDFLIEGVELFEPTTSAYGTLHGIDDHGCYSRYGPSGDRFFTSTREYPKCDGTQYYHKRGECDVSLGTTPIVYEWTIENEYCGTINNESSKYSVIATLPFVDAANGPPCDFVPGGGSIGTLANLFICIGLIFNGFIMLAIIRYRNDPKVKATQPGLVMMIAFGAMMLNASSWLFIDQPTDSKCMAQIWVFNIAFDITFTILWCKIYRVYLLFKNIKKFKKVVVKESEMYWTSLGIILIDVVVLSLWSILDPPQVTVRDESVPWTVPVANDRGTITYSECHSQGSNWSAATTMFKVLLILSACILVYGTKNVPSNYVEHKFIIIGVYNTAVLSGVALLLTATSTNDPRIPTLIHCAGVAIGSMVLSGSLALPRILVANGRIHISMVVSSSITPTAGATSVASSVHL